VREHQNHAPPSKKPPGELSKIDFEPHLFNIFLILLTIHKTTHPKTAYRKIPMG
jgi:hypothetical protein